MIMFYCGDKVTFKKRVEGGTVDVPAIVVSDYQAGLGMVDVIYRKDLNEPIVEVEDAGKDLRVFLESVLTELKLISDLKHGWPKREIL